MENRRLRVGLIGVGTVGQLHLNAYRQAQNIQLICVADTSPERLAGVKKLCDVVCYSDPAEMLRSEKLDIVAILTPPANREKLVSLCADHGVNILCEKPFALSLDEADRMLRYVEARRIRLFYGSSYRFLPAIRKARSLIKEGAIGTVRLLREQSLGGKGAASVVSMPFSHYPQGGPGGFAMGLADHGIHLIDVFGWLTGSSVVEASGQANVSGGPVLPEYMTLRYSNGAIGQIIYDEATFPTELPSEGIFNIGSGWDIDGYVGDGCWTKYPATIHVYGTNGSLRIFHYANLLYLIKQHGIRQIPLDGKPSPDHFGAQIDCFAEDIINNRPTTIPGKVGRETLRTLLSIFPKTPVSASA